MFIEPVARFRSPFKNKFGIPRQAGLAPGLKGRIVFEPGFRCSEALRGLEGFDYIWLIWGFSGNKPCPAAGSAEATETLPGAHRQAPRPFQATVRPPRLGGNERVGVFASRSPFRPNGLGLSSVRIDSIEYDTKDSDGKQIGPVINVLGADLMDGTPVYDIKPYVTYADSHPEAASGFVDDKEWRPLKVEFDEESIPGWTKADLAALKEVLAQDPRPQYRNDPGNEYGMIFNDMDIRFKVDGDLLTVIGIKHPKAED